MKEEKLYFYNASRRTTKKQFVTAREGIAIANFPLPRREKGCVILSSFNPPIG
jgi:hypothetical protein